MLRRAYLLAYNLSQLAGWSYVGALLLPHLIQLAKKGGGGGSNCYADCSAVVRLLLVGAYLEVVHNLTGTVRGSPILTMSQVTGRVVVACLVTDNFSVGFLENISRRSYVFGV